MNDFLKKWQYVLIAMAMLLLYPEQDAADGKHFFWQLTLGAASFSAVFF